MDNIASNYTTMQATNTIRIQHTPQNQQQYPKKK